MKKKPKIIARRRADKNHEVITVSTEGKGTYRRTPCDECPWRKDARVGAFPAKAYKHSAPTAYDMGQTTFACHMAGKENPATCAGFLLQNSMHNFQVRMQCMKGSLKLDNVRTDVELYGNYRAMAIANGVDPDDPVLAPCRDDGQLLPRKKP